MGFISAARFRFDMQRVWNICDKTIYYTHVVYLCTMRIVEMFNNIFFTTHLLMRQHHEILKIGLWLQLNTIIYFVVIFMNRLYFHLISFSFHILKWTRLCAVYLGNV